MKHYFAKLTLPIIVQLIFTILYSATVALFPILNQKLFDNMLTDNINFIAKLVILYIGLISLNIFFQYFARLYEWIVTKKFNEDIKEDLFLHIASLEDSKFKVKTPTEYSVIFNNNIDVIYEDYISAYIDLIKSILNIFIFAFALLMFVDWRITIVVITSSIIISFLPKIMQKKLSSKRKQQLSALSNYYSTVSDLLSGKKRINKFSINPFIKEHLKKLNHSEDLRYQFGKTKTISDVLNDLGVCIIQLFTFVMVAFLLFSKDITIGTGIAAFGYVSSFLTPIQNILQCVNCINSSKDTVEETLSFMKLQVMPSIDMKNQIDNIESLTLSNISFEVDNFKLNPINYEFEMGKRYAIIGHSGSGKSTLMRIIDGSLEQTSGKICINNHKIDPLDRSEYIFSIEQSEHLFHTDFLNNITIFESYKDTNLYAEILLNQFTQETKCKIINYDDIEQLSGGEKQIIAILRMLVSNRQIILLDESFSSIDKKNTQMIKDYLLTLKDKIIIEVTHDISETNLDRYDNILRLDEGTLIT
jgi:ABC-type bacteriocin/lantibiotic exporter with double-glycine peptidase domain